MDVTTTNDGYKDVKHACGAGTDKNKIPPDLAGGGGGKGSGGWGREGGVLRGFEEGERVSAK